MREREGGIKVDRKGGDEGKRRGIQERRVRDGEVDSLLLLLDLI